MAVEEKVKKTMHKVCLMPHIKTMNGTACLHTLIVAAPSLYSGGKNLSFAASEKNNRYSFHSKWYDGMKQRNILDL